MTKKEAATVTTVKPKASDVMQYANRRLTNKMDTTKKTADPVNTTNNQVAPVVAVPANSFG